MTATCSSLRSEQVQTCESSDRHVHLGLKTTCSPSEFKLAQIIDQFLWLHIDVIDCGFCIHPPGLFANCLQKDRNWCSPLSVLSMPSPQPCSPPNVTVANAIFFSAWETSVRTSCDSVLFVTPEDMTRPKKWFLEKEAAGVTLASSTGPLKKPNAIQPLGNIRSILVAIVRMSVASTV